MDPRTPISLITGALGSGKTTLLRRILSATERRIAVLMNEFGEIAIDSRVLPGQNLRIIELAGGCVCCELTGEFEAAVNEVLERYEPELIVVEATGVAEADALAYEVQDNLPQVRLDSVIHIIDAYASIEHPEIGYAARSQLRQADVVLINKTDLVASSALAKVAAQVRAHNERAFMVECVRCGVDENILFGLEPRRRDWHGSPHGGASFEAFVYSGSRLFDRARFEQAVAGLPGGVYRAKGFVRFRAESCLFNYVAGRMDLEAFEADKTELVFIGPGIKALQEGIAAELRKCEVPDHAL
jgi:G3E family GTPase